MKKTVYGFVVAVLVLMAGCDQVTDALSTPGNKDDAFVAVTNITLLKTSMIKNTTIDLNDPEVAEVTPDNATVKGPVKWFVIDAGTTEVATGAVAGGTLTPTAAGTFTLSATIEGAIAEGTEDYEKLTGLSITVTDAFVPVTGITWTAPTGIKAGMAIDLSSASVTPPNATNQTITWTASGAGLSGIVTSPVTPAAAGTLTLTATIVNGLENGDYTAEPFVVTVGANTGVDLSGVTLSSVVADGSDDTFAATTKVTLTFSGDVPGLEAGHISFEATEATMTKGTLVSKGSGVYELPVDALLNAGPNAGKTFTVTVSDGANTPLTDTVTLYAWIAVATKDALAAIGTNETTLAGWYKQTQDITINDNAWVPIGGTTIVLPLEKSQQE